MSLFRGSPSGFVGVSPCRPCGISPDIPGYLRSTTGCAARGRAHLQLSTGCHKWQSYWQFAFAVNFHFNCGILLTVDAGTLLPVLRLIQGI